MKLNNINIPHVPQSVSGGVFECRRRFYFFFEKFYTSTPYYIYYYIRKINTSHQYVIKHVFFFCSKIYVWI